MTSSWKVLPAPTAEGQVGGHEVSSTSTGNVHLLSRITGHWRDCQNGPRNRKQCSQARSACWHCAYLLKRVKDEFDD